MTKDINRVRKTAGEISNKLKKDSTKYNALEVGHAMTDDIEKHLYEAAQTYHNMIDENEYCVVMLVAKDPLINNMVRRKFYCWPYLPSPRPNQAVFLYNKIQNKITKRLWVLPSDMVMAELSTLAVVDKRYKTMQAWAVAFFQGRFWEYIRYEHGINMPSEHEYFLQHREELIKAGCKLPESNRADPFDFSKIHIKNVIDSQDTVTDQYLTKTGGQTQGFYGSVSS
jgi:hypothetical protein